MDYGSKGDGALANGVSISPKKSADFDVNSDPRSPSRLPSMNTESQNAPGSKEYGSTEPGFKEGYPLRTPRKAQ